MPATVTFHRIVINSQELGSDDEHMVSTMTFTLTIGDESFEKLMVVVKQTILPYVVSRDHLRLSGSVSEV